MSADFRNKKLRALPVQFIEVPNGVILKRGCTEVKITGHEAADAVKLVLDATRKGGTSVGDIHNLFPPSSGPRVDELIEKLIERNLLVPSNGHHSAVGGPESNLDVFFWHFDETAERVTERVNKVRFQIIGVNYISRQLAVSLAACGHRNFQVIDDPRHRNTSLFNGTGELKQAEWPTSLSRPQDWENNQQIELGDCLVVTSDFGGQQAFCAWNKLCIDRKVHFLPVVLKNLIGHVGPLVIPGETACYECLITRQLSHTTDPDAERVVDQHAFEGQTVNAFHPSMATILGDLAAFELTRFYGADLPERKANRLLEVNLLAASMAGRTVLKMPRCVACSALHKTSETNLHKILFPNGASDQ